MTLHTQRLAIGAHIFAAECERQNVIELRRRFVARCTVAADNFLAAKLRETPAARPDVNVIGAARAALHNLGTGRRDAEALELH